MNYGKRTGLVKITAIFLVLAFGMTIFFSIVFNLAGSNSKTGASKESAVKQTDNTNELAKYVTTSHKNDIDIEVHYLNPVTGDKDTLAFEVIIGTRSVDLTNYKDIQKYTELRTDTGFNITDGFTWTAESSVDHHISGLLTIKNSYKGKPIIDDATRSFKLIFRNIGGYGEQAHEYGVEIK